MKVVIDTNVIVSALRTPQLERVLRTKMRYSEADWDRTLAALPVSWIEATTYQGHLAKAMAAIRDADDAPVVAVALLLKASVVSGDNAFHPLRRPVVKTWRPREMVASKV